MFRALNPQERVEVALRLQVLAQSSPEDKKARVETLHSLGEIVGVTGDCTNDDPALETANVRFSMGIAGWKSQRGFRHHPHGRQLHCVNRRFL